MDSGARPTSTELIEREARPVRRWLLGYFRRRAAGDGDGDAEDHVQEVFARIVARDGGEPVGNLNGYVLRVAASVLADRGRRRLARHADAHVAFDPDLHADEEIDAERVLGGREELRAATGALLGLPERTRTVFVLRRLEGWRFVEIARHCGISVSAAEKHMVRAVRHLAAEMEKRDAA
jgi:RNA polymerase sigma-70 factor (ECF subfamily)